MAKRTKGKQPQVHSAFADDDESDKPKLTMLPGAADRVPTSRDNGAEAAATAAPARTDPPKKKKAARDFSALLSEKPTYTKWTAPEEESTLDPDATVVDTGEVPEMDMAAMMGFAGFGGEARKSEEKKKNSDRERLMMEATRREEIGTANSEAAQPAPAAASASAAAAEDDDDDDSEGGLEAQESIGVPISHEVIIKHGAKPVSAMDLDAAGGRLITGGYDYKVRLWDFAAMDARMKSFRQVEPAEGVQVRQLVFSKTGDLVIVCTGSAMPKVLDRDGFDVAECLKGDQYFNDLSKTYGHVSIVTDAVWHPNKKNLFITASADSTVRVWNTDTTQLNNTLKSTICGKCRSKKGKRSALSALAISVDGKLIAVGCEAGSIQTFALGDKHMIPKGKLLSRGTDGTVAIWEPRQMVRGPSVRRGDLPCYYPMTEAVYSPDEKLVLTGLSGPDVAGQLVMLHAETLEPTHRITLGGVGEGVIRIRWHVRINQIAVSLSSGQVRVLFDNVRSVRGATLCVAKAPRKANVLDAVGVASFGSVDGAIVAPHTHKAFRDEDNGRPTKRKHEKSRKDPIKSRMPQRPIAASGPFKLGYQGQVRTEPTSLNQFLASKTSYDKTRDEDPREAILRHAEEAEKNPQFVNTAYTMMNNRVEPIFNTDYNSDEDEQAQGSLHKKAKFDPMKKPFQVKGRSAADME